MIKIRIVFFLLTMAFAGYVGTLTAPLFHEGTTLFTIIQELPVLVSSPFSLRWIPGTTPIAIVVMLALAGGIWLYVSTTQKAKRDGEEYGSAKWGDINKLKKKYTARDADSNIILSRHMAVSVNKSAKKCRNLNTIIVGGPGTGKTQGYVLPNLMQCNTSFIVTDPKGEIVRSSGQMLIDAGYEVRVLDLVSPDKSSKFNPFEYIRDDHLDEDTMRFVEAVIRNTTDKKASKGDGFWEQAEVLLMLALVRYIKTVAPVEEQNFETLMLLIRACEVREDDETYMNAVDILMDRLEENNPDNRAVDSYKSYKMAAGKTAKSILISSLARLSKMDTTVSREVTAYDEMDLYTIGDKKTAVFCIISDSDDSMNFLAGLFYTFAFQSLYHQADNVHNGGLPIPVHCIMDEFANIVLPDSFQKLLATMRSRNIACSMIVQTLAQLKALYKDDWHVIIGNCALQVFLGGSDPTTTEYFSKALGKQTIDTQTYNRSFGSKGSSTTNFQRTGRELLLPDEIGRLPIDTELVIMMGEMPIKDKKFDPERHKRIKATARGGAKPYLRQSRMSMRRLADFKFTVYIPDKFNSEDPTENKETKGEQAS